MVQKLITTFVIVIFLVLVIAGLEALSGGSSGGTQEISHILSFLSIHQAFATSVPILGLFYAGIEILGSRSMAA
jgi:hypothetical protein